MSEREISICGPKHGRWDKAGSELHVEETVTSEGGVCGVYWDSAPAVFLGSKIALIFGRTPPCAMVTPGNGGGEN